MYTELSVVATAATPILELRAAIPLAFAFGFSPLKAYLLAVVGNSLIVFPVLYGLRYGSEWVRARWPTGNRILAAVSERTQLKHGALIERVSFVGLMVFVAVPLPMTGAWSACVIVFLCKLPLMRSAGAIITGVAVAGLIVLGITAGAVHLW